MNSKPGKHFYFVRESEISGLVVNLEQFIFDDHVARNAIKSKFIPVPNKWVNSRYIALFDKTEEDIVCPHFWEFKPFIGCPFNCHYCYLHGTFFGDKKPRLKQDFASAAKELDDFLSWADSQGLRLLLNSGELADSLAIKKWTSEMLEYIIPVLEKHKHHKVLLLSKAGIGYIDPLLEIDKAKDYFIVSFSINTPRIAEMFEEGASPPEKRLEAAKILQENDFIVRIRIDPMIPVSGWIADYNLLVHMMIYDYNLTPERVTLGTLRGLHKTIEHSKYKDWVAYLDKREYTHWGLKVNKWVRLEMYRNVILKLKKSGYKGPIALCKETLDIWEKLNNEGLIAHPGKRNVWENVLCNCKF